MFWNLPILGRFPLPCPKPLVRLTNQVGHPFKSTRGDRRRVDGTAEVARAAGAVVWVETRQSKGNVVRRMFGIRPVKDAGATV